MAAVSHTAAISQNGRPEQVFGKSCSPVRWVERVIVILRDIYPVKPAASIAADAEVSSRAVEHWFSGARAPSPEALIALLQSENGFHVLSALMGDARPAWWRKFQRGQRIAELRREQEKQRRALEQLEMESGNE